MKKGLVLFICISMFLQFTGIGFSVSAADANVVVYQDFTPNYPFALNTDTPMSSSEDVGQFFTADSNKAVQAISVASLPPTTEGLVPYPSDGNGTVMHLEHSKSGTPTIFKLPDITEGDITVETRIYRPLVNPGNNQQIIIGTPLDTTAFFLTFRGLGDLWYFEGASHGAFGGTPTHRTGWQKIKIVLKHTPGQGYKSAEYYYDDMETPLSYRDGGTGAPRVAIPQGTAVNSIRFTVPSGTSVYIDYIKVSVEGAVYSSTLEAPSTPQWNEQKVTWSDNSNNASDVSSYEVALYKNDEKSPVARGRVAPDVMGFDFTEQISSDLSAQWRATVKANGKRDSMNHLVGDSIESPKSLLWEPLVEAPAKPQNVTWQGASLTWDVAANADSYVVNLYKEGLLVASKTDIVEAAVDLFADMENAGNGTYTAEVAGYNGLYSEYSQADEKVFDIIDYRRIDRVIDFEEPTYSIGDIPVEGTVVESEGVHSTGQYLNSVTPGGQGQNSFDLGKAYTDKTLSIKLRLYIHDLNDQYQMFLDSDTDYCVNLQFNKGSFRHRPSGSGMVAFTNNMTYEAGWQDLEIRLSKLSAGEDINYTSVKYILNGVEALVGTNPETTPRGYRSNIRYIRIPHGYVDDIHIINYKPEVLIQLPTPKDAVLSTDGKVSFTVEDDKAKAYEICLYEGGELFSTITDLDTHGGLHEVDISAVFNEKGNPIYENYTATVKAKGDYSLYRESEVASASGSMGLYSITDPIVTGNIEGGETITAVQSVQKTNEGDFAPYSLIIGIYSGNQLVVINSDSISPQLALGDTDTLTASVLVPADISGELTAKILRWNLVTMEPIKNVLIYPDAK